MKRLTGKTRYRTTWRGKVVLQICESYDDDHFVGPHIETYTVEKWRDATVEDLTTMKVDV